MPLDDHNLNAAITGADSPEWSVRATAGRQLAAAALTDDVLAVVLRLLLDPDDTAVTQDTAEALLARGDGVGLRCVLLALSRATSPCTMDELGAALDCTPLWMTDEGTNRLTEHLRELATDPDAGVRTEAAGILGTLRPHTS
ncbi:hypothetical protein ACIPJS_22425 [Streptomyces sp. NPDC086783]|uniref:hypothetical protein n=1 Tax=Streptomyces sp. NPDC086783 TaxID=3365758 RepID=UPI00381B2CBF